MTNRLRRTLHALLILCLVPAHGLAKDSQAVTPETLISDAFKGFETASPVDHHVHFVGLGKGLEELNKWCKGRLSLQGTPASVHSSRFSLLHPSWWVKTWFLLRATNIKNRSRADLLYAQQLVDLATRFDASRSSDTPQTKFFLLAMASSYTSDATGAATRDDDNTDLRVTNRHVVDIAACLNDRLGIDKFIPVISVHPLQPDASTQLNEWASKGVRYVKWLPNSMNIVPDSPDPRYKAFLYAHAAAAPHTHCPLPDMKKPCACQRIGRKPMETPCALNRLWTWACGSSCPIWAGRAT